MALQLIDYDELLAPIANVPDHRMHSLVFRPTDYTRFQCDKALILIERCSNTDLR